MSDVDIAVDAGDLKAAIALLNEYGMSFTNMVNKVQTESNKLARAAKATSAQVEEAFNRATQQINNNKLEESSRKEAQILKQREQNWRQFFQQDFMKGSSTGINSKNSALVEHFKEVEDQMKQTAVAAKAEADQIAYLTKNYAPLVAAEQRYNQIKQEVQETQKRGLITIQQEKVALDQLEKEYQALGNGVYLAGSRFNQFGQMAQFGGKSASRFGMYAQQAGYQVGDFAVQLQSGANAGVAFSQQAAQLAGLIPGLAGAVTTFAAIGLGLWIQQTIRMNEEGKKTGEIYEDLGSTLDKLESIRLDNVGPEFVAYANQARQEFEAILQVMEKIELQSLKATLDQPLEAARKKFNVNSGISGVAQQIGSAGFSEVDILGQKDINLAVQAYQYLADIQGESKEELAASLELQTRMIRGSGLMTDEMEALLSTMAEQLGVADLMNDKLDAQTEKVTANKKAQQESTQYFQQQAYELQNLVGLEEVRLKYGENSLQYLDEQKNLSLETFRIELSKNGIYGQQADYLTSLKERMIDFEQASERSAIIGDKILSTLQTIAGVDISSVFTRAQASANALLGTVNAVGRGLSQLGRLGQEAAALKAEQNALANNATPGEAKVAGDTVRYGHSLEGVPQWARGIMQRVYSNQQLENLKYTEENATATKAWNDANNPKGGGGKGGKSDAEKAADKAKKDAEKIQEKLQDFISDFELNIKQQERLTGVFGEQREELEKVIEIENRLGDARGLVSEKQIQAWANEELALERKLQKEQDLYNIGNQNFENFLMTIVNGTASVEEAFKAMLANMISDIYQKFVAEGAADVAGNFLVSLFSAKGNAFGSGGVKMFAKGGVVNSPTGFKHSGGLGVMGEAGPEAIMPLKRNSQGRLGVEVSGGGSGNVEIKQYFSMSANGDQAVKAIIQQEMPRIANASKQAVIEGKRRGEKGL